MSTCNFIISYDISDNQKREELRNFLKEKYNREKIIILGGVGFFASVRKISESTYNIKLKLVNKHYTELKSDFRDTLVKIIYNELKDFAEKDDSLFVCFTDTYHPELSEFDDLN